MPIDTMPLHDLIDEFRKDCGTAQVLTCQMLNDSMKIRRIKPQIDFDHCHVIDFGYLFNAGSGLPETLTEAEALALKQPIIEHGVSLAYPQMLLVERTRIDRSILFITYVYQNRDGIVMEYYIRDMAQKHWVKGGHVANITCVDGVTSQDVLEWSILVPTHGMPKEDLNPINHFVRMTLTLLAILMRRGDEVEQTAVPRPPVAKPRGFQKKDVASVSIIKLNKIKLIKNVVDEHQSIVVDEPSRQLRPHNRMGAISHRIKDELCVHVWTEEFRDSERWRNRCEKCDSCQFWRRHAKVHGGAEATVFHKVVR
jgi:hypothetical protein